jgi:hypothetical protein
MCRAGVCPPARHISLRDDVDGDGELDVRVQLGRDDVCAERLDRFGEYELAPVDLHIGLRLDGGSDVGRGDRPARADTVMTRGTRVVARASAAARSCASRRSRARRMLAAWSVAPAVAFIA